MQLDLPVTCLEGYKSASQRARVATEVWAGANLYCPNCTANRLRPSATNTPAVDYLCTRCDAPFQLKSQRRRFARRITDAAYVAMRHAIEEDRTPNLFVLHYEPVRWRVCNVVLVPSFAFTLSVLERRKPLGPNARRAGWVGCNILLANIPFDAKITVVLDGVPMSPTGVRRQYESLRPLAGLSVEKRGWTLDVLNVVRLLDKTEFSLAEVYAFEQKLGELHPANRFIRDKIRQQLQVLRDLGFVEFLGRGNYRLR